MTTPGEASATALADEISALCAKHGCNLYVVTLAVQHGAVLSFQSRWFGEYLPLKGLNVVQSVALDREFVPFKAAPT